MLRALFNIPFSSLELIARMKFSITGIPAVSHSRIFRMIHNIKTSMNPVSRHYDVAIDSTGFKIKQYAVTT